MENTSCRNKTPLDKFKYAREKSVFDYFGWSGSWRRLQRLTTQGISSGNLVDGQLVIQHKRVVLHVISPNSLNQQACDGGSDSPAPSKRKGWAEQTPTSMKPSSRSKQGLWSLSRQRRTQPQSHGHRAHQDSSFFYSFEP